MTLDQLRYFIATAKHGHLGRAAKSIPISPSAVSAAISALELEFGCTLFERRSRQIFLTEAGRALQREAVQIFSQIENFPRSVGSSKDQVRGHFRLGASHYLASHFLGKALFRFQKKHPSVSSEILPAATEKIIGAVLQGSLELGICFSPLPHPDLEIILFHRGRLKIAVGRNHALIKKQKGDLGVELSKLPALLYKASAGVEMCEPHPEFVRQGISIQLQGSFESDELAAQSLFYSQQWALLPSPVIETYSQWEREPALAKNFWAEFTVAAVHRRDSPLPPALVALVGELRKLNSKN